MVMVNKQDVSYIDDCIDCLAQMGMDPEINRETINIGPDEEVVTINDLASLCANETGLNSQQFIISGRPQEVKHATCSSDKARELLNYQTKTTLAEL